MANHKRVAEINYNFELPEHIIQRIQSFLSGKAAAQTAVLSKSWLKAWLTRPNIDFGYEYYRHNIDELLELANRTIQRYEESNLKIESFKLRLNSLLYYDSDLASTSINTLILKALKLCAHLSFEINHGCNDFVRNFVIAREVFESENLLGLSVIGCRIDMGMDHNVRCSKLQSLSLNSDGIDNPGVIFKIISSCPLIENLSLSCIFGKNSHSYASFDRIPINLPKMHNLKCLALSVVELDTLFFRDMSSKFPSLRDLTLQDLSVGGCTFDVGIDQNVRCLRLESLSLDAVGIGSLDMISEIILSCPLIENMSLSKIRDIYCESVITGLISLPKLHNIKCLVLCRMPIDTLFLCDLSSKFPFLKDLTLHEFLHSDQEEMQISSNSLEHLNLLATESYRSLNMMFELDVPSIRKFTFAGWFIPSVSFTPTSREWESHISIHYMNKSYRDTVPLDTSWFLALNELLTALIPSKIYLSINSTSQRCFTYEVRDAIQGLPQPEVENLTVDIQDLPALNCYALFDGIFRTCRPKIITQYLLPDRGEKNSDFICKTLAQAVNGEFPFPRNFMYGLNDLKEVNVQVFDVCVAAWKDLPCKSLSEASESPEEKKNIRFQLLWKP